MSLDSGPDTTGAVDDDRPRLRRVRDWLGTYTFAPFWLSGRWRRPVVGYAGSALAILASILVDKLLVVAMPGFAFPAAVTLLAVLGIAATWGAGPSLIGTALAA